MWPRDLWFLDPLPIPPNVSRESATFWRWFSRVTLQARAEER